MKKNVSGIISLVEKMGYQKFFAPTVVEYSVYQDNQNYLDTNNIIKVIHPNGKLFALQADITMSICESYLKKNREDLLPQKYYYFDEIFANSNRCNKNIENVLQFGVEYFCSANVLSDVEIVYLAYKSLNKMDQKFVLEISYSTILKVLMAKLGLNIVHEKKVFRFLKSKNIYELKKYLDKLKVNRDKIDVLIDISNIKGEPDKCLDELKKYLGCEPELEEAYNYLTNIASLLKKLELIDDVTFDFSIINNMNYYSGIIFKGYVSKVAKCVLNGGRYENITFDNIKPYSAVGFTLTIEKTSSQKDNQSECLIIYREQNEKLANKYLEYLEEGKSVQLILESEIQLMNTINVFDKYNEVLCFDGNEFVRKEKI